MNISNSVLNIEIFGQGLRPRTLSREQNSGEYNWLYFVKEGALYYSDENVATTLVPQRFYILPAIKSFTLENVPDKNFNHLYIKVRCSVPITEFLEVNVSENDFLNDFFNTLMKHSKTLDTITVAMLLNTVLHLILPPVIRKSSIAEQIKIFVDERLPSFSMAEIITRFHYSKRYLDKKFKEAYNTSIVRYGKNEQLSFVAEKISEGETLSVICDKTGYSSPANLSRDFKKHFGLSPTEYNRSN